MNSVYVLLMTVFYILNVAENKYLTIDNEGNASLSSTPVSIDFSPAGDGTGRFDVNKKIWLFKAIDAKKGRFVIGYNLPAANATNFIYANTLGGDNTLATTFAEPGMTKGQWIITSEQDVQVVELDEKNTYEKPTFTGQYVNVSFIRDFAAGQWNSLCVPFPIDKDMAEETWGYGTELAEFVGFNGSRLLFQKCEIVKAGTPCLLKPAETKENNLYFISGIPADNWASSEKASTVELGKMQYIGTYTSATFPSRAYVFGGTNTLYHLTSDMKADGYRAYFWDATATANPAKQLSWGWGTATGIEILPATTSPSPTNIYRVDGKLVKKQATSIEGLRPGIYIMNGMKVVVK